MIQTSCSELLVDTQIHDPEEALKKITKLMELCGWESSPPVTLELLGALKHHKEAPRFEEVVKEVPEIVIFDKEGNRAFLEYGDNGYLEWLGYRFDSHCNHVDSGCYPIFQKAIEKLNGKLIACDGGSTDSYKDWEKGVPESEL